MVKEYEYWVREETKIIYQVRETLTEDKMGSVRVIADFYDEADAQEYVRLKSRHLQVVPVVEQ